MLGCCLALFWHPRQLQAGVPPVKPQSGGRGRHPRDWSGSRSCASSAPSADAFLYRGGFLLVDVATIAVIAAVAHPAVRFGRRLGIPLLVYIGVRSYSIYLWHWPVFALTRPGVDIGLGPGPVFVIRLVITFVLADLSYRLIETPDPQRRHRALDDGLAGQHGIRAGPQEPPPVPGRRARRDLACCC